MRKKQNQYKAQLNLFHPCPEVPDWRALPTRDRREVVELLARLLRKHQAGHPADDGVRKEMRDE